MISEELENQEQLNSDVSESSSETQEQAADQKSVEDGTADPTQKQQTDNSKYVPYDRFQEVIAQKNELAAQAKQLQEQYTRLDSQIQQMNKGNLSKTQEDALISRLKGIDPEFGGRIEQMHSRLSQVDSLTQRLASFEQNQLRSQAENAVKGLHEQYKVPENMRNFYRDALEAAENRGELKNVGEIPNVYKKVHDQFAAVIEATKRSERESYVKAKAPDSKLPTSQPKGKQPAPQQGNKAQYSKDPEEARAQLVARYLKTSKAADGL
jgi:hypothetical protein